MVNTSQELEAAVANTNKTKMEQIWECKIGANVLAGIPRGADGPIRAALEKAFFDVTGVAAEFSFGGWGAALNETERAIVNNPLSSGLMILGRRDTGEFTFAKVPDKDMEVSPTCPQSDKVSRLP